MSVYQYPEPFENLVELLKGFPGVGRKSAERMALSLLDWDPDRVHALGEQLNQLHQHITLCRQCGNLSAYGRDCRICLSAQRDKTVICVVEEASQIISIEKGAMFKGVYHVLGGKLSPLSGRNVEDLNIDSLTGRIEKQHASELILALSQDVEGQATAMYIANMFKNKEIRITRLASGLPAGSDIAYADSATIAAAFSGRISL